MKTDTFLSFLALTGFAVARPVPGNSQLRRREVPQENSHKQFLTKVAESLNLDNPDNIQDPVFGLLGNEVGLLCTKSYQLKF